MSTPVDETVDTDQLVDLQLQDAALHKQLVESLDGLMYEAIFAQVFKDFSTDENDDRIDQEIKKELEALQLDTDLLFGSDGTDTLEALKAHLLSMVKLRNEAVDQQLISGPDSGTPVELELQRNEKCTEKTKLLNSLPAMMAEVKRLKSENQVKLENLSELVNSIKLAKARSENNHDADVTKEEFQILKNKYKKLVAKNLMLSNFITSLVSAMTSADIANDELILEILLECGEYKDYDLFE